MLMGWGLIVLAGLAMGATSIGGVLVVPALNLQMGLDLPEAIAISSQAFFWTSLWTVLRGPKGGLTCLRLEWRLLTASLVGAVLGAWLSAQVPGGWLRVWIGALALLSGLYGLGRALRRTNAQTPRAWPGWKEQSVLGACVGLGSALSGTGGPVMLLPYLMLSRRDFERSVATALVLQLPIAFSATTVHALDGRWDIQWGLATAAVLWMAMLAGKALAQKWSATALQAATAWLLLATGIWLMGAVTWN